MVFEKITMNKEKYFMTWVWILFLLNLIYFAGFGLFFRTYSTEEITLYFHAYPIVGILNILCVLAFTSTYGYFIYYAFNKIQWNLKTSTIITLLILIWVFYTYISSFFAGFLS